MHPQSQILPRGPYAVYVCIEISTPNWATIFAKGGGLHETDGLVDFAGQGNRMRHLHVVGAERLLETWMDTCDMPCCLPGEMQRSTIRR